MKLLGEMVEGQGDSKSMEVIRPHQNVVGPTTSHVRLQYCTLRH